MMPGRSLASTSSSRHSRKTVPGGSTLYCSCNMIHRRWANDDHNASATDLIHMQDATTSGRLRRVVPARSQGPEMAEKMAPRAGFEPATNRLTAGCSTAELPGSSPFRSLAVSRLRCGCAPIAAPRSEEHTSELQSLMRISYAVFFLKKNISSH